MDETQAAHDPFEPVLAEYMQHVDRGEHVDCEEFIAAHPEVAPRLRAYLANADAVQAMVFPRNSETEMWTPMDSTNSSAVPRNSAEADSIPPLDPCHCVAGRYEIRRLLGRGGMGTVYLAHDNVLDRPVALKTLSAETWNSEAQVTQLLDEARAAARLKHPGIVAVYDAGRDADGSPYLVMELIEGRPLSEVMKTDLPDLVRTTEIVAAVAEAMAYAHRLGFVHRDLKPANILVDGGDRPHIADFGLALHESQQRQRPGESSGTLFYMAPEQARGDSHRLDGRTDIWALGVILYELLLHRRPFDGTSRTQVQDEILHRDPKPPRQIIEAVPAELERICLKCLAKDPNHRYLTASDLARDLRHWATPTPPRRSRRWSWAAAAVAGMLLAAGVWHLVRKTGPETGTNPAELQAKVDIRIWRPGDPVCQNLSVVDERARPLRVGDGFKIEVKLSRPAYVYLLNINGQGHVTPLYPWQPGNTGEEMQWHTLPLDQKSVGRVTLPTGGKDLATIDPPGGMETVVFLARETPLTDDTELLALLPDIVPQPIQDKNAIVCLTNGQDDVTDAARGRASPATSRTMNIVHRQPIDDRVQQTLHKLHERLASQFPLVRTITVANQGE
ncbi:MAG: serine/threonine-protein kinase [Thermoguttaceae bacterium]